jgi:ABC-type polysaccharide/polyol phosphate export permease
MTPEGTRRNKSLLSASLSYIELVFHCIVRDIRKSSGSAALGIINELMQAMILFLVFYVMFSFLGLRGMAIRGDFVVFLISGIFLFMLHNKALASVLGAADSTSGIMKHAPMTTALTITAAALSALYIQVLAMGVVLVVVHVMRGGLDFYDPARMILPVILSWSTGCGIGLLLRCLKPFVPRLVQAFSQVYRLTNMFTSGKMTPANMMGYMMIPFFAWNPLFHTIDQARGAAFVNYVPRHSNLEYPIIFTIVTVTIGLMGEAWLRKNQSASWGAR